MCFRGSIPRLAPWETALRQAPKARKNISPGREPGKGDHRRFIRPGGAKDQVQRYRRSDRRAASFRRARSFVASLLRINSDSMPRPVKLTPMLEQYFEIKRQVPDAIL